MVLIFIRKTCKKLGMRVASTSTAQVLYHRFFSRQSVRDHDRYVVALTCIFLASKVEEDWKSLEYVVEAAHSVRNHDKLGKMEPSEHAALQAKVLLYERIVLNTLSFDVSVDHPHHFVDKFIKMLTGGVTKEFYDLSQSTWNILNDSLSTTMCLRYPPRLIAAAAVSFAIRLSKARAQAGTIPKPRYLEVTSRYEKQGKLFEYKIAELRMLEEEFLKYYEGLGTEPQSTPVSAGGSLEEADSKRLRVDGQ